VTSRNGSQGGDLIVTAPESILLSGTAPNATLISGQSGIFADAEPAQIDDFGDQVAAGRNSGNLLITTGQLTVEKGAKITADTFGLGKAGEVTINVDRLLVRNGGLINAGSLVEKGSPTLERGDGGNLKINASESVEIVGTGRVGKTPVASTLLTAAEGTGNAGNLEISTPKLTISDGAIVTASTSGSGKGGSITVRANSLAAENGSQIRTTTSGNREAGNITLLVDESITLSGNNSGLFANTTEGSTGRGGSIFIDPNLFFITDGAAIAVDSLGTGAGGNITIFAQDLLLNRGRISAETTSGTGGDITLLVGDILQLRNGSQISTTAGNLQQGGDGGNITIRANFILAFPQENSNIAANAFTGRGGMIQIFTQGIFGIEPRQDPTFLSDITASSSLGVDGLVQIEGINTEPIGGLANLPEAPTEVKVAQGCRAAGKETVVFFQVGKGGVLPSPMDLLTSETLIAPWVLNFTLLSQTLLYRQFPKLSYLVVTDQKILD
jgi:large exoprotein involved in heme utilization and adhesion